MPPAKAMRYATRYDAALPSFKTRPAALMAGDYDKQDAVLQICNAASAPDAPAAQLLDAAAARRGAAAKDEPLVVTLPSGVSVARLQIDAKDADAPPDAPDAFARQERLRAALAPLLALAPRKLALDLRCDSWRDDAIYTALVASARLPSEIPHHPAPALTLAGAPAAPAPIAAARANTLARALTLAPPNHLTPAAFAASARAIASASGNARVTAYSAARLQKMGAGAICAVGQAAAAHPPILLHIAFAPRQKNRIALVGKGVTYDTGGINVKPARHMRNMGRDMAGAAAALAAGAAATALDLPVGVDVWLALADNCISHNAYRPDEVITAANGKRIEIVHSDAEGRMILADTLVLASRRRPQAIITFATLTGTMCTALGTRMSGFFASDASWQDMAMRAAATSGERLCYLPMPADYKTALKSEVADIKQCAEEGEADHIMAALFLREFIEGGRAAPPWLHLDLSAVECKGGLAAAPGELTGFGAAWALALLQQWTAQK